MPLPSLTRPEEDDDQPFEQTWGIPQAPPKEISSFKPVPQPETAELAPKIDTGAAPPHLSQFGSPAPKSILGTDVPPGEQISDKQMPKAEHLAENPKDAENFQAHQERSNILKDFGQKDAAIQGQIVGLANRAIDHDRPKDYFEQLGKLHSDQGAIQAEKAHYERENPWGTAGNHPGVFGKIGHVLGEIGNVAGAALAPGLTAAIPGSQLNLAAKEHEGQAEEKFGSDLATAEQKAQAATNTSNAHLQDSGTKAEVDPRKTAVLERNQDMKENTLPNQISGEAFDTITSDPSLTSDQKIQKLTDLMKQEKAATNDKFQHVAGTINGKPAFGAFNPGDHKFYDPQTGALLDNFVPPPNFAQTGSFQPTMVATPQGSMVPGTLNARTGQVQVPKAGANTAIPKDVQSEVNKELDTARNADRRLAIMEHNLDNALRGDQQAMVSLVANHIGMTLGAQKGARINQAVWEEAVASRPWLQGAAAQFDSRGYLSGIKLSPEQMHQMVGLAKEVRDQQWNQANHAFSQYGINVNPIGDTPPEPSPAGGGGGRPSVAEWLKSQHK